MLLQESQAELIESCRAGDAESFRALFEIYKDRVYTVALRYSGNPETAEDIAQDTFLKLFSAIRTFRGDSTFEGWLYRLVVNACFDQKRRARRFTPLLDLVAGLVRTPGKSALDGVLMEERDAKIREAIGKLPPEQRIAVVLRYSQGLSYEEMAAILECPAGTIASRLNRAHSFLEKRLKRGLTEDQIHV